MSSATLTDALVAEHGENVGLLRADVMGMYADIISGQRTGDDYTPAKRAELYRTALGQHWPELWREHDLTFPSLPPEIAEQALVAPPEPTDTSTAEASLKAEIHARARVTAPAPTPEPEPATTQQPEPQPATTQQPRPEMIVPAQPDNPDLQTYTCIDCGITWSRPKTKGQPPRRCPPCRDKRKR